MDRSNRYEAAFEAYLRHQRFSYIATNEQRRTVLHGQPIKNLDFIVCGPGDPRLVIDVKGRRFPAGPADRPRRVWECWSTAEDVADLQRWADAFGPDFLGLLVFVYALAGDVELAADTVDLWTWRNRRYLVRAIEISTYRAAMRVRSPKWATVDLPGGQFRQLARPFRDFANRPQPAPAASVLSD